MAYTWGNNGWIVEFRTHERGWIENAAVLRHRQWIVTPFFSFRPTTTHDDAVLLLVRSIWKLLVVWRTDIFLNSPDSGNIRRRRWWW